MPIRSLADLNAAYDEGRCHSQRFLKGSTNVYNLWCLPEFASGQPPYQPRLGTQNTFVPCVMQGNDDIWYPDIDAAHTRYLHTLTLRNSQVTYAGPASVIVYDLIGYYPLVDASVGDLQSLITAGPLPRYADGDGVMILPVQYIAPNSSATVAPHDLYVTDADGVDRVVSGSFYASTSIYQTAAALAYPLAAGANSSPFQPLGAVKGVRKINAIQFTSPQGTFYALYLVRPIATLTMGDNQLAAEKDFFMQNGSRMPEIKDGACLNFTFRVAGANNYATSWFGQYNFVWG